MKIKTVLFASACAFLSACGGGDSQPSPSYVTVSPTPTPTPTPSPPPSAFTRIVSPELTNASIMWEAITVADINGDNFPDVIMANGSGAFEELRPTDPKTTVLINNGSGVLSQLNTSNLSTTGWVNDWLVIPSRSGNPHIVGIDHGREIELTPEHWSKNRFYQFNNGSLTENSERILGNEPAFYHNGAWGDFNKDGLNDFVTVSLNDSENVGYSIFHGDANDIFRRQPRDPRYNIETLGLSGAVVAIDLRNDGQQDFILLPYHNLPQFRFEGVFAESFVYANGALSRVERFDARTAAGLPDSWGYSFAQVADLNKDGLQDFIALAEDPLLPNTKTGRRGFVTFMQKSDGTFDIFPTTDNVIVDSQKTVMEWERGPDVWSEYKFQLVDVDGDGNLDMFWGSWFFGIPSEVPTSVFYGDGTGKFLRNQAKSSEIFRDITWQGRARTHMADFNNDGIGDLLVLENVDPTGPRERIVPTLYLSSRR